MHDQVTEQRETLKAETLVAFRRLGAERVHFALVMPETITAGVVFGAPCDLVAAPIVGFCSRTLRGNCVVIPSEYLDGWKRQGKVCRECQLVAQLAVTVASNPPPLPPMR